MMMSLGEQDVEICFSNTSKCENFCFAIFQDLFFEALLDVDKMRAEVLLDSGLETGQLPVLCS